jgi:hypothetical protein
MSNPHYIRVIPRDLFNEANLLKCMGRLWIETERFQPRAVEFEHDGEPFLIEQDEDSGSLFVANVQLRIHGQPCTLWRPLNSRRAFPLYLRSENGLEEVEVFEEDGKLSAEMLSIIQR